METMASFGKSIGPNEIISLRKAFRWSQEQLAREVGVSVSSIWKWEQGHAPPTKYAWKLRRLLAAAEFLNNIRKEIATKFPDDYHRS